MTVQAAHRARVLVLVGSFLVALLALTVLPFPASAQPGTGSDENAGSIAIGLREMPAHLSDDPRAQRYIVDHLPPGTTITRLVAVSNFTDAPQDIDVYAGPATVGDGAFVPQPRDEENLLTRWISVDRPVVHLQPGESTEVVVTIAVPADAPEIEQYAGIWASHSTAADGAGIDRVSRVGVRVYLSVGHGNGPPSDFVIIDLRPIRDALGIAALAAVVHNTGSRAVDIDGTLDLTEGPGGMSTTRVGSEYTTIGPGDTADVLFVLDNSETLPAGPWQAKVDLSSGVHQHEEAAEVQFPEKGEIASAESSNPVLAWIVAAAIAALAMAVLAWLLLVRRRRDAQSATTE